MLLIQSKQKCLSHMLALDECLDPNLNLSLAAGFSPSWTLELLPLHGQHVPLPCLLPVLLHCSFLGQNHPGLHRI